MPAVLVDGAHQDSVRANNGSSQHNINRNLHSSNKLVVISLWYLPRPLWYYSHLFVSHVSVTLHKVSLRNTDLDTSLVSVVSDHRQISPLLGALSP